MSALGNLKYRTEALRKGGVNSLIVSASGFALALISWVLSWPAPTTMFGLAVSVLFLSLALFFWQLWYLSSFFSWTAEAVVDGYEKQTNRLLQAMATPTNDPEGTKKESVKTPSIGSRTHWVRPTSSAQKPNSSEALCLVCSRRLNSEGRCPAGC